MLDVRLLPDEDPVAFLEAVRRVIDDPVVTAEYAARDVRPIADNGSLDSLALEAIQAGVSRTLPGAVPSHDEHRRHRHGIPSGAGHAVLRDRAGDGPSRTWRWGSAPTATRSASARTSSIASCASTGTSCSSSRRPAEAGAHIHGVE